MSGDRTKVDVEVNRGPDAEDAAEDSAKDADTAGNDAGQKAQEIKQTNDQHEMAVESERQQGSNTDGE
jgi:hypothetical protein